MYFQDSILQNCYFFGVNHNYISYVNFYGRLILFSKGHIMEQKVCREFKTHWF